MDKEKQIEEMARTIGKCKAYNSCKECITDCEENCLIKTSKLECFLQKYAKRLYKNKYRKINENEVVISKDNYNRLKRDSELYEARHKEKLKLFAKAYNQGSKETAEKILKGLYCLPHEYHENEIEELAKEFGVDLGE